MASFLLRDGRWQAIVRRKGHRPQYKTFRRKLDAERWAHGLEEQIHSGIYRDRHAAEHTTVAQLCRWYEDTVTPTRATGTTEPYRLRTLSRHLGHWTAAGATPEAFVDYARARLKEGRAPATIRRELQQASDLFNSARALRRLDLPANPVATAMIILRKLRVLKPSAERTRRLHTGEQEALLGVPLRACTWIQPMVEFALETAMRRGEIARMRRQDVQDKTLRIYQSKTDWKTGKAGRTIPLSPRALAILEALPVLKDTKGKALERFWPPTDEHSITRAFARLVLAVNAAHKRDKGVPKIMDLRFHDLRHEAASRLFEKGYAIEEVAVFTGHRDWASLKRYTHPDPAKIAAKMVS